MNNEDLAFKIGCGVLLGTIFTLLLTLFLSPLIMMLGWNLGIVTLFPTLPKIGYWTAFWSNLFLTIMGNKFKSGIDYDKIKNIFNDKAKAKEK